MLKLQCKSQNSNSKYLKSLTDQSILYILIYFWEKYTKHNHYGKLHTYEGSQLRYFQLHIPDSNHNPNTLCIASNSYHNFHKFNQ